MGLLDDAIREHLDLKRRRGADPAEVERAEREALGPVRRSPESVDQTEIEQATIPNQGVDHDAEHEQDWGELFDQQNAEPWPPQSEPAGADKTVHATEPPTSDDPAAEPATLGTPLPPPASGPQGPGEETREYDVEGSSEDEPRDGDEMLEETPEFLQDAPDHDRLWFEQRPPRDFDFDG